MVLLHGAGGYGVIMALGDSNINIVFMGNNYCAAMIMVQWFVPMTNNGITLLLFSIDTVL